MHRNEIFGPQEDADPNHILFCFENPPNQSFSNLLHMLSVFYITERLVVTIVTLRELTFGEINEKEKMPNKSLVKIYSHENGLKFNHKILFQKFFLILETNEIFVIV